MEDGEEFQIPQRPTVETHKLLGVYISPYGNRKRQVEYMKSKVRTWKEKIGMGNFYPWKKIISFT